MSHHFKIFSPVFYTDFFPDLLAGFLITAHILFFIGVTAHSHDFLLRIGKEIRFRFGSSGDKAGKEAKRRPTSW